MFLPIFIAILLGLASPFASNSTNTTNGGTYTTNGVPGDGGGDNGGSGGGPLTGENGQIPPPKKP